MQEKNKKVEKAKVVDKRKDGKKGMKPIETKEYRFCKIDR
jgi:hypothetical protein